MNTYSLLSAIAALALLANSERAVAAQLPMTLDDYLATACPEPKPTGSQTQDSVGGKAGVELPFGPAKVGAGAHGDHAQQQYNGPSQAGYDQIDRDHYQCLRDKTPAWTALQGQQAARPTRRASSSQDLKQPPLAKTPEPAPVASKAPTLDTSVSAGRDINGNVCGSGATCQFPATPIATAQPPSDASSYSVLGDGNVEPKVIYHGPTRTGSIPASRLGNGNVRPDIEINAQDHTDGTQGLSADETTDFHVKMKLTDPTTPMAILDHKSLYVARLIFDLITPNSAEPDRETATMAAYRETIAPEVKQVADELWANRFISPQDRNALSKSPTNTVEAYHIGEIFERTSFDLLKRKDDAPSASKAP